MPPRIDDIRILMSENNSLDILAINEIYIPGFEAIRKDRKRGSGGVREDLSNENLECITLEITKPRTKPFLISAWYNRPPAAPTEQFTLFEELIGKLDKVTKSDVAHLGISDHSMIYVARKVKYPRSRVHKTIELRTLKNFDRDSFFGDLGKKNWVAVSEHTDPNEMWAVWKTLLTSAIDKHAPCKNKKNLE